MRKSVLLLAVCAAAVAVRSYGADAKADYERLQKWQYGSDAISITQPLTITRDTATWTLTSGTVHLAEPTASGRITGLVFEGAGRFVMTIPDPYEQQQLARFTEKKALDKIDEPITQLVLRTSDDTIDKLFPTAKRGGYAPNGIAEKRQNHWLIDLRTDIDARIVGAMANPDSLEMMAGMKTAGFDWLTFSYDSAQPEAIELIRWDRSYPESWLRFDPPAKRGKSPFTAKLTHIDVKADLTKRSLTQTVGDTEQRVLRGHYIVDETFTPIVDGTIALPLTIASTAQDLTAKDEMGEPLVVLRDHIGARSMSLDKKIWDSSLIVIFPMPLKTGQARHVTFEYDLETANYAPGNAWYPTVSEAFDEHTATLDLLVSKANEVRAMGKRISESEAATGKTSKWVIDKPTKMITWVTAEHFAEEKIEVKGIPAIISFGSARGFSVGTKMRNAGADVANAMQYFQGLLGDPIGGDTFYVTSIAGNHGQAFDGFLHLSEFSYEEHPGASELFRAHEVAHEWFGHRVGWHSYRDQWLSESLAEYAAMMFVQSTVKDGPKYFDEILNAYDSIVKGNIGGGFSKFNRPWLIEMRSQSRARLGPIADGYRASTGDMPQGYDIQAYVKGPLVIHMLRTLLRQKTHNDDVFVQILRDWVHDYSGKLATTADFEKVVERNAPGDWSWFFRDWVYGAEVPTIRWSWKIEPDGDKFRLTMDVKRSDAGENFKFIAPVRVDVAGDKFATIFIPVNENEQTIRRELPMNVKNVVFAPDHALLANIRRE